MFQKTQDITQHINLQPQSPQCSVRVQQNILQNNLGFWSAVKCGTRTFDWLSSAMWVTYILVILQAKGGDVLSQKHLLANNVYTLFKATRLPSKKQSFLPQGKWELLLYHCSDQSVGVEVSVVGAQLQERERWRVLRRAEPGEWLTELAPSY